MLEPTGVGSAAPGQDPMSTGQSGTFPGPCPRPDFSGRPRPSRCVACVAAEWPQIVARCREEDRQAVEPVLATSIRLR